MRVELPIRKAAQETWQIRRALRLVWQASPLLTLASIVLMVIQSIFPVLTIYLMKLVVDTLGNGLSRATGDGMRVFEQALPLIVATGLVSLLAAAVRSGASLVNQAYIQIVTAHIFEKIHAKSIELDMAYYENSQYHDTLHRAQQQAAFRPARIVNDLMRLGQSGLSLLSIVGLLVSFNLGLTVFLFLAAVPGSLLRLRYSDKMYRWQREKTLAERRAAYYNVMLISPGFAKEIRLFGLGQLFKTRFRDLRRNLDEEQRAILVKQALADLSIQASATLAVIVSYAFIAYQTALGVITLGGLVMYYQAFQRGQGFLQDIISSLTDLYENNLFVSSLFEFLDQQSKITSPASPQPVPRPMRAGVVFENVGFQYPASPHKAINDVNFTIRPGEVVALVGANGAGKTTLIKLLCRLYDPDEGRITIDGVDLREFDATALRQEISVIFQDYIHYQTTARENVWFGNIETPPDQQAISAAARLAGIDEKLSGLKSGYDTVLGKWFEDGEELSIGEWQKVALARAFMRNAQLIVLDEPTSAMDAEAEYEIFSRFKSLISGKSAILISHRLSTVKMADRIYVVEHGTILESGTHAELMSRGARYAHLFETQSQFYN